MEYQTTPQLPITIDQDGNVISEKTIEEPGQAAGFEARKDGLFVTGPRGNQTRICDPIWHLGIGVRDDNEKGACDLIKFIDRKRVCKTVTIPLADAVNHPKKVFDVLADHNFAVPQLQPGTNQPLRDAITAYLAECRAAPERWFLLADRMGWHGSAFVLGNHVITTDTSKALMLTSPIAAYAKRFTSHGDLAEYQDKVLRRASYSSRLMTGIALALLAPLARIVGLPNGGLNFVGQAGIGKTTILRVAGSFYGGGPVPYYVPWLMTDSAPETLGLGFCDLPLLLDELDALEPDPSRAGGRLKAIVHRLAMGQGKARSHHALNNASAPTDFHVLYGSTSEHRLPDFMRDGGSKMTGGQAARFVDIPADAGRGLKVFEALPRSRKSDEPPDIDRYLQRLNRACERYYGAAGRRYLECLVRDLDTDRTSLETFVQKEMARFEAEVANHPQVDPRVRRRFAGLFAAGQLGLRYGVLHPRCDRFMEAISSCYWAAIATEPAYSLSDREVAGRLAKFLHSNRAQLHKVKSAAPLTEESYRGAVGLIPDQKLHADQIWLKSGVLQTQVFQPAAMQSAIPLLVKSGAIVKSAKGSIARQQRVPYLDLKEYFYVIDTKRLNALAKGNSRD